MAISNPNVIWKLDTDTLFYKYVFNRLTNVVLDDWGNDNFCWLFWRTVLVTFSYLMLMGLSMTTLPGFLMGAVLLPAYVLGFHGPFEFYLSIDGWLQSINLLLGFLTGMGVFAAGAVYVIAIVIAVAIGYKYFDEKYLQPKLHERRRARADRDWEIRDAMRNGTYEKPVTMADVFYEYYKAIKMKYCPTIMVAKEDGE